MCLTFKKNNKQTKKPVNRFLQDDASAGIRSLQASIEIKLCQNPWNGLLSDKTFNSTFTSRASMFSLDVLWRVYEIPTGTATATSISD